MSLIISAVSAGVLAIFFVMISVATVNIERGPHYRGFGRRPLISIGWITAALTFGTAALYLVWLIDVLVNRGGVLIPNNDMVYMPSLVLVLCAVWGLWAFVAYLRSRPARHAALDARMAPSVTLSPASGGEFRRALPPKLVASAKGAIDLVVSFTKGSRHER